MTTVAQALEIVALGMAQRAADVAAGRSPTFNLNSVHDIASQLSVDLPATVDTFVFYSGGYLGDVGAAGAITSHQAATSLAAQAPDHIGLIDNTDVATFLALFRPNVGA